MWSFLILWQSHSQIVHFHFYKDATKLNFFVVHLYLDQPLDASIQPISYLQIIFHVGMRVIEFWIQKDISCMQWTMKLASPSAILCKMSFILMDQGLAFLEKLNVKQVKYHNFLCSSFGRFGIGVTACWTNVSIS